MIMPALERRNQNLSSDLLVKWWIKTTTSLLPFYPQETHGTQLRDKRLFNAPKNCFIISHCT